MWLAGYEEKIESYTKQEISHWNISTQRSRSQVFVFFPAAFRILMLWGFFFSSSSGSQWRGVCGSLSMSFLSHSFTHQSNTPIRMKHTPCPRTPQLNEILLVNVMMRIPGQKWASLNQKRPGQESRKAFWFGGCFWILNINKTSKNPVCIRSFH